MKIGVIDNDVAILEALVEILLQMGFEPIPFNCPKLALAVLSKTDVQLVLVDYMMPDMLGSDFIAELKKTHPFAECLIMTANGYGDVLIDSMKSGAVDLVRKPFNLDLLETSIRSSIAKLQKIPTLAELEKSMILKALAVCKTEKDAAAKLGINYTTLYRKKKTAA